MLKLFYLLPFLAGVVLGKIEPPDGLRENAPSVWALQGGKVYVESSNIKKNATIIIRDGLIEKVGIDLIIPKDATVTGFPSPVYRLPRVCTRRRRLVTVQGRTALSG